MSKINTEQLRFTATQSSGEVSALLLQPQKPTALLVFAHGAGAGMQHEFMEGVASGLYAEGIATLRFNFPYMEKGKNVPDPAPVAIKTVCAAVAFAFEKTNNLPLFAGGKSFGGRMISMAAAQKFLPQVHGFIFFGYPLHAIGKESLERAQHLPSIEHPLLFLQGTKDKLAEISLIRQVCTQLGSKTMLYEVAGGDHSFHVGKLDNGKVLKELCNVTGIWIRKTVDILNKGK